MQALRRQLCSRWLRDVSVILRTGSELICSQSACVSSLKAVTIADSGLVPLPDTRRTSDASSSGREFPCSYRAAESVKPRFLSYSAFSFIRTWSSSSRLEDGADPSASTRSEEGLREGLAPRTRRRRKGETSGYEEGRETSNYKERGGGLGTFLAVSNREAVEYKRVGAMSPGPFRVPYKEVRLQRARALLSLVVEECYPLEECSQVGEIRGLQYRAWPWEMYASVACML